jgi:hypothetical protein
MTELEKLLQEANLRLRNNLETAISGNSWEFEQWFKGEITMFYLLGARAHEKATKIRYSPSPAMNTIDKAIDICTGELLQEQENLSAQFFKNLTTKE